MLDRFDCYELCVQSPRHLSAFLHALHPGAVTLHEDFCGTAALSRRWIEDGERAGESRRALATDLDAATLEKARVLAQSSGSADRIEFRLADVLEKGDAGRAPDAADLIFVGNFSIGYIHDRAALVSYLAGCADRLRRGNHGFGGGWFICDTYGGASAFKLGGFERRHPSRGREFIRYHWSHDAADPLTGIVENSISFRVELDGEIIDELPRAFTYRWRLWSIAELREAMKDAGFVSTAVYKDVNLAPGQSPAPVADPAELGDDWIVMVAAQA
ncbi:MAG: hypothetical protein AMXMBFR58_37020 [Phycisphaerae bacterium]